MNKIIRAFITIILISLVSCGPSAKEKAVREKFIKDSLTMVQKKQFDSIVKATEEATKFKFQMKITYEDSIKILNQDINRFDFILRDLKAELEIATDKMGQIKEWEFGRTPSEREEQVRNQSLKINDLEKMIENIKVKIDQSDDKLIELKTELNNMTIG
jgi:hypothetical protein